MHEGIDVMVQKYHLERLEIFERQVLLELLSLFFSWMLEMGFINYRITLNEDCKLS